MQSEAGQALPTTSTLQNPVGIPTKPITTNDISSTLVHGESPLDFIKRNLRKAEATNTAAPMPPEAPKGETISPEPEKKVEEPLEYDLNPKEPETSKTPEAPKEPEKKETAPTEVPAEEIKGDKEENFKNLRKKLGETSSLIKEKDKTIEELSSKVKKYETGEEVSDVIKARDAEIERLRRYESLHSLKTSEAYKETYIKPLGAIKEKLGAIAKDYEIPPEVLDKAIGITNRKELNTFLSEHFDEVGALEVKELISKAQDIQLKAGQAEKEPAEALQRLEKDFNEFQEVKRAESNNVIVSTSKDAWVDSLLRIRKENKIHELIHKDTDPEYNKNVVTPILQAASSEYGKLIKMLVNNGLSNLTKDVASALARTVLLAHASAVSIEARAEAQKELQELQANTERNTRYLRPPIGSSAPGGDGAIQAPPSSPQEAARQLIRKVQAH